MERSDSEVAVDLRGLTKRFRSVVANDGISVSIRKGTLHGVIGENGAGKSTAMKMLYGMIRPDAGEIRVHGAPRQWRSSSDAIRAGIGMVHQHFMLAGPHTVLDNIVLGADGAGPLLSLLKPIDRAGARAKLEKLMAQYKLPVKLDARVEELPVGIQQRIEILKLLYREAEILILDEPTAVLTPQETHDLFVQLRKLREEGKTIIVITHKLKEVMALTDEITVFRAGKVAGRVVTARTSAQELADLMVGRKVLLRVEAPPAPLLGPLGLEVEKLTLVDRLKDVSFRIHGGEVVGIAGVEGNGQGELLHAILHPSDPGCRTSGQVRVLGEEVTALTTAEIRGRGVGVIPADRHREGILLESALPENFLLGLQREARFREGALVNRSELRRFSEQAMEEYDVRPRDLGILGGGLSGGNQQKLVVAREILGRGHPRVLVAAQPTRGVDVGAIEFIHNRILAERASGAAVLLVSSELEEILSLSDRVLVMYEGRIVAEYKRGEADERSLGLAMGGAS